MILISRVIKVSKLWAWWFHFHFEPSKCYCTTEDFRVITTAPWSGLGSDLLQSSVSSKAVYTLRASMSSSLVVTAQWTLPTSSWSSDNIGLRCLFRKYCLQNKARSYGYNNRYSSESGYNIVSLYSSQTCFYTRSKLPINKYGVLPPHRIPLYSTIYELTLHNRLPQ